MITIFNRRTVYVGTELKDFQSMRDFLEEQGIKYKYSVKNLHSGRRRTSGALHQYEIWVHANDYDRVKRG